MDQRRTLSSPRLALPLLLVLMIMQGCGPEPRPVVHVSLGGLPEGARALRAEPSLDGAAREGATFESDLARFSVRLSPGERGQLSVAVAALGADGCVIGRGAGQTPITDDGLHALTVEVLGLPIAECAALSVARVGDGEGEVVSSPEGIACGDRCGFVFAQAQPVRLTARAGATSYFDGWAGGCSGLEACQVLTRRENPRAVATFKRQVCTQGGWCWENPLPHGYSQAAVWGSAANDVWSVGDGVLHWDGQRWDTVETGLPITSLNAVWGSGPRDVFATGWSTDVPVIVHFDGVTWKIAWRDTSGYVLGVWGSGPNDVFAVGGVAMDAGLILHWDGAQWQRMAGVGDQVLTALWGSGPRDVLAVGYRSRILRFDGERWTQIPSSIDTDYSSVWGSGKRDVFLGGSKGVIAHYDGHNVTRMRSAGDSVRGLWGSGPQQVFASVSNELLRFDGGSWKAIYSEPPGLGLNGLWGTGTSDAFAVGEAGFALRWNGHDWTRRDRGTRYTLTSLWGSSPDNIWAVGWAGRLAHWDGDSWRFMSAGVDDLSAIWGSDQNHAIALGYDRGTILLYDGQAWQRMPMIAGVPLGVWTNGPDEIWIAGQQIYRWDGASWQQRYGPDGTSFEAIWGSAPNDLFAVGADGRIVHFDGTTWAGVPSGTTSLLVAVWGSGPNDVYAAGFDGTLLRGDRRGFTQIPTRTTAPLFRIHGSGPRDVYILGGAIYHWDGASLKSLPAAPGGIASIWASAPGRLHGVGFGGTIVRYQSKEPR